MDFVVFGPSTKSNEAVLRVGVAEQAVIQDAGIYVASIGDPQAVGHHGMISIEELTAGDVSEDLIGLEVYHVSPLRPISVVEKRAGESLDKMRDAVLEEFSSRNTAIIETPDEEAWSVSALKYLNECDELMPDPLISTIRGTMSDTTINFNAGKQFLN